MKQPRDELNGAAERGDNSDVAPTRVYRSIFLDDDCALHKYYGWNVDDEPVRVLRKKRLGFTRSLVLLTKSCEAALPGAVARAGGRLGLADVTIHDFDGVLLGPPLLAGRAFRHAEQSERLLNIATYVIDLQETEETLWKKLGAKSRNAVRKAESEGVKFVNESDFQGASASFYKLYGPIARQHNLSVPDRRILQRMNQDGNILCVSCSNANGDGSTRMVNMIYLTTECGYYMLGARAAETPAGCGQLIQWRTILLLKRLGFSWYDLGGVQVQKDPIHRFKKSLGGTFFNLGAEYKYESSAFKLARAALRGGQRLSRWRSGWG